MGIPFTRFHRPDGRRTQDFLEGTGEETERLADDFIKRGGWFEVEVLTTGQVSLTACWRFPHGGDDIEIEICANDDDSVIDAAQQLVQRAAARTDLSK